MMTVATSIDIYAIDDEEIALMKDMKSIIVRSHWNRKERAVLEMPDGKRYTIWRADLQQALENAGNCR